MRETIIHRSAQKLANWHAERTRIDPTRQSVIDEVDRSLKETEQEFEEAAWYLEDVEGNDLAAMKNEIARVANRLLQTSE